MGNKININSIDIVSLDQQLIERIFFFKPFIEQNYETNMRMGFTTKFI
jgi:hypothetical protein